MIVCGKREREREREILTLSSLFLILFRFFLAQSRISNYQVSKVVISFESFEIFDLAEVDASIDEMHLAGERLR